MCVGGGGRIAPNAFTHLAARGKNLERPGRMPGGWGMPGDTWEVRECLGGGGMEYLGGEGMPGGEIPGR